MEALRKGGTVNETVGYKLLHTKGGKCGKLQKEEKRGSGEGNEKSALQLETFRKFKAPLTVGLDGPREATSCKSTDCYPLLLSHFNGSKDSRKVGSKVPPSWNISRDSDNSRQRGRGRAGSLRQRYYGSYQSI